MLGKFLPFIEGIKWKVWLGALAAVISCLPVAYCKGRADMAEKRDKAVAAANLKVREAELRAERLANQNDALRQAATLSNATERKEAIKEAVDAYPEETGRAVGPATRAVTDRLRATSSQAGATAD